MIAGPAVHGLRIVLGLGNPGPHYAGTRHNLGAEAVDRLAGRARTVWRRACGAPADVAQADRAGGPVLLARPRDYMNRSGEAAAALAAVHDVGAGAFVIVVDDADLEFGRVRVRPHGSCAGHNGLRSVAEALGTEAIVRVRLGVRGSGRPEGDLAGYVLARFDAGEAPFVERLAEAGADAVEAVLDRGVVSAMREFNGRPAVGDVESRASAT